MTRVHQDRDAARVLRLLRRLDEGATVEQLAHHLYRQPPYPQIVGALALKAAAHRAWRDACKSAEVAAHTSISRLLRRLTRSGYVEDLGPPRIADWVTDSHIAGRLLSEQRLLTRIKVERPISRRALGPEEPPRVPGQPKEKTKGIPGCVERAYDRLVADGFIVAPSVRRLSAKGLELLLSWESE